MGIMAKLRGIGGVMGKEAYGKYLEGVPGKLQLTGDSNTIVHD